MCGKCEQASFLPSEHRAGIGLSKVGHMLGTFLEVMIRQDRPLYFHLSDLESLKKCAELNHLMTDLFLPLDCTVVWYNTQSREVCTSQAPSTLPGPGLH